MIVRRGFKAAAIAASALVAVGALSACSEIDSLQQVSGNTAAAVTFATTDVLINQKIPIKVRPRCHQLTDTTLCEGSTMTDEKITVQATNNKPIDMTVKVGDKVIFTGSGQEILNRNAEGRRS